MQKMLKTLLVAMLVAGVSAPAAMAADKAILGAGATFPYPLYSKMFDAYNKKTGIQVNYQAIGSGGGIQQISAKTVEFGASDAFLKDKELATFSAPVVHIPMALGSVAIAYNIPGNPDLKLTPDLLANIYLGNIKKWNDPKIKSVNPGATLPNLPITVVYRSDGSGTTSIFTTYLAEVNKEWAQDVGAGKSVNWPTGVGGKGNSGVAGTMKQITGSIAYLELSYCNQNKLQTAALKNASGKFISPSLEATALAAEGEKVPADTRINLVNSDQGNAYPIVGMTWVIVYKDQAYGKRTKEDAKQLVELLWWMVHDGQQFAEPLDYAKLSPGVQKKAEAILKSISFKGETLL